MILNDKKTIVSIPEHVRTRFCYLGAFTYDVSQNANLVGVSIKPDIRVGWRGTHISYVFGLPLQAD
jgi:hypothetical protein